ncbi:MAG: glutamine synthetase family protein [Pseudomonadota bacterium]
MIKKAEPKEARDFLAKNPGLESIDLIIPDINGVYRGKRIQPEHLVHAFEDGICLSKSLFASDITGETADDAELGFEIGDMDCTCWPIAGTLTLSPWKKRREAQCQMMMSAEGGTPYLGDPQNALDKVLESFSALGLTPVVAIELEFYLIDRNLDGERKPQQTVSPVTGKRQTKTQVYSITDLDDYGDFIADVDSASRLQGLPTDVAVAEYAPGQFEINLMHQADAQLACRHGLLLKRLIKGVAQKNGMEATFMPKPFADLAGSGTHIHVSLLDKNGQNIFAGEEPNAKLKSAVAGTLASMNESMLIYAPNANSYRRMVEDWYVPLSHTWGLNNRTVALRIPTGSINAMRLEHRVAGADANPYLLTASVLAGMYHGIHESLDPPPMVTGNAYEQDHPNLPAEWLEAINTFRQGKLMERYLGDEICRVFVETKQQEYDVFKSIITPTEYDWYLRSN